VAARASPGAAANARSAAASSSGSCGARRIASLPVADRPITPFAAPSAAERPPTASDRNRRERESRPPPACPDPRSNGARVWARA
jgi:hypothetical protein